MSFNDVNVSTCAGRPALDFVNRPAVYHQLSGAPGKVVRGAPSQQSCSLSQCAEGRRVDVHGVGHHDIVQTTDDRHPASATPPDPGMPGDAPGREVTLCH